MGIWVILASIPRIQATYFQARRFLEAFEKAKQGLEGPHSLQINTLIKEYHKHNNKSVGTGINYRPFFASTTGQDLYSCHWKLSYTVLENDKNYKPVNQDSNRHRIERLHMHKDW